MFKYLSVVARIPGAMFVLAQSMRIRVDARLPIAFGWLTKQAARARDLRLLRDAGDLGAAASGATPQSSSGDIAGVHAGRGTQVLETSTGRSCWRGPENDRFFKLESAQRLAKDFPNARLEVVEDSRTFLPEDQPGAARGADRRVRARAARSRPPEA